MLFRILLLPILLLSATINHAQTSISGVINDYTPILQMDSCIAEITVQDASSLIIGDKILIIQMKGAEIIETNDADFGTITNWNGAGNYERATIQNINGNTLSLQHLLLNTYDVNGKVQLVRIPQYDDVVVTDTLKSIAWNGSIGGVLALDVSNTMTLNAPIDVSGQGFMGGISVPVLPNNCSWLFNEDNYFYDLNNWRGAAKGEGIVAFILGKELGRGPQANGGGGGNDHNSGGGGGSNMGAGGFGGINNNPNLFGCSGMFPGEGGKTLNTGDIRLVLGGGGGAGHTNNLIGSSGGNGGGIILIRSKIMTTNNHIIQSNGQAVSLTDGDGAGGGGAGGSILLEVDSFTDILSTAAQGGRGGDTDNHINDDRCVGPGGGGSGGFISSTVWPFGFMANVVGGDPGIATESLAECNNTPNGATQGEDGVIFTGQEVAESSEVIPSNNITLEPVDGALCENEMWLFETQASGSNLNYQWQMDDGNGFQNLADDMTFSGTDQNQLLLNNPSYSFNGNQIQCVISGNACFGTQMTNAVTLTVAPLPISNFTYTDMDGTIDFTDLSLFADSYSWDFDDETALSTLPNPTHTYTSSGTYNVSLTVTNACGSHTFSMPINVILVSQEEVSSLTYFEIFPNPSNGKTLIHIQADPTEDFRMVVSNSLGQKIMEQAIPQGTEFIPLEKLSKGIYWITLHAERGITTKKLLIQ